jgi:Fe-S-cluster containining protein
MTQNPKERFQFPWYQEGLSFSCTQCGKCCTGAPGYVWVDTEEMRKMAEFLNLALADFKRLYVRRIGQKFALVERKSQNHSCVFYQNQKCQVYAARPLQCRAYPFWKENLLSEASWKKAAEECEGIHPEAPLVSSETIEKFLEVQSKQHPDEYFVASNQEGANEQV